MKELCGAAAASLQSSMEKAISVVLPIKVYTTVHCSSTRMAIPLARKSNMVHLYANLFFILLVLSIYHTSESYIFYYVLLIYLTRIRTL